MLARAFRYKTTFKRVDVLLMFHVCCFVVAFLYRCGIPPTLSRPRASRMTTARHLLRCKRLLKIIYRDYRTAQAMRRGAQCNTLQHNQHTVIDCNTQQYTAIQFNGLQHTCVCKGLRWCIVIYRAAHAMRRGPWLAWVRGCCSSMSTTHIVIYIYVHIYIYIRIYIFMIYIL